MTQESIVLSTTPPYPGLQMVQDINKSNQALATDFAGPDDPAAVAGPHMKWLDTSVTPPRLRRRNAANTAWLDEGVAGVPSLPIFPADAIPTANIGPIYIVGLGEAWWSSSRSSYIPLRAMAYYRVGSGVTVPDTVLTLLPLQTAVENSMGSGISSPSYAATPGLAGLYEASLTVRVDSVPRITRSFPSIYKNGVAVGYGTDINLTLGGQGASTVSTISVPVELNGSTDFVQAYFYAQKATGEVGNPAIDGAYSWFTLRFIK